MKVHLGSPAKGGKGYPEDGPNNGILGPYRPVLPINVPHYPDPIHFMAPFFAKGGSGDYICKKIRLTKSSMLQLFAQSPQLRKLQTIIADSQNGTSQRNIPDTNIKGLIGSSLSFVVAGAFKDAEAPFLFILNDKEEAAYHLNDLEQLLGDKDVLFYPGSYRRPYQIEETDNANVLLRAEVLNRINSRKRPAIIVTYP